MKELYISPEATVVSFVANQNIAYDFDAELAFNGLNGALLQDTVTESFSDIEIPIW